MDSPVAGFKIWYSNSTSTGRTYADWCAAQDSDVQVVVIYYIARDALGRYTRRYSSGHDYYALDSETTFTDGDDLSILSGHVLVGAWMDFAALVAIEQASFADYGEWLDG